LGPAKREVPKEFRNILDNDWGGRGWSSKKKRLVHPIHLGEKRGGGTYERGELQGDRTEAEFFGLQ